MSERSNGPAGSPGSDAADSQPIEVGDGPFGLTGTDDEPPPQKAPRSRTRTIVLGALLAASLAGAGVLANTAWRISSQKGATLAAPERIAQLSIDQTENGVQTAEYLATALSADVDFDKAVGAVYSDAAAADRDVLFFGGTTLIWTPSSDLDAAFDLVADDQGAVTGLHEVSPGSLGGTMKCGTTKSEDGDIAVCGWADHGSLALALFPNRPVGESAVLMRQMRTAIETRN
jgi:hypothetical protein